MLRARSPSRALAAVEWLALTAAIAMTHLFYLRELDARAVMYPHAFDAQNYLDIAEDITRKGLFSDFFYSNIRTYGYPLFLAMVRYVSGADPVRWQWLVFEVQLGVYVLAVAALRRALIQPSPALARISFVALLINPFVLSHVPLTLSESLALTLVIGATACWLHARAAERMLTSVVVGTLLVSYSVMVRPANVFALGTWIVAIMVLVAERRPSLRHVLGITGLVVLGIALPIAPQYANNVRFHAQHTPLVASRLGTNQHVWGVQYLKYATALPPVQQPSIFYDNPLLRDRPLDPAHPLRWYVDHPGSGATTLALHVFNLLDQDLLFTYSRDLDPWYRRLVGVANYALVALALVGLLRLAAQWRTHRSECVLVGAFVLSFLAVHAPTAVEMRFGAPLLALFGPLAGWVITRRLATPWRPRLVALAGLAAAVITASLLSDWVRAQSPAIVVWQAHHG